MMRKGTLDVEEHGQISLGFYRGVPPDVRADFRARLSAMLRPRRHYAKRIIIRPDAMVRDGDRALAEADHNPSAHNACVWFVRVFYMSAGDELLCFDAGPFVRVTADRAKADASHYVRGDRWDDTRKEWIRTPDPTPQPIVWHATREADKISALTNARGARHAVLPSQRAVLQHNYNEAIAKDPTLARSQPEE